MRKINYSSIDEYIAIFPEDIQKKLKDIRKLIRENLPIESQETISYQIPCFKLNGKSVIYFAGYKNHISIYLIPKGPKSFQKKITPYVAGKGTLKFPNDKEIPFELIKKIVKFRVEENLKKGLNAVSTKMNPVVHFEMPAVNKKRAKKFYETAFGWEMNLMGPEMGHYLLATTTPIDKKTQTPKKPGAINGGFFQKPTEGKVPHLVVSVDNLKKHMEIIKKAGGKVKGKPLNIPGIGDFVIIKDSEGNNVGLLQPSHM